MHTYHSTQALLAGLLPDCGGLHLGMERLTLIQDTFDRHVQGEIDKANRPRTVLRTVSTDMKKILLSFTFIGALLSAAMFSSCEDDDKPSPIIESLLPESDGVGAEVKINGKNFGTTITRVSLDFNGTPAGIQIIQDTLIITHVPAGATTGKINLAVNGRSTSSQEDFVVLTARWEQKADLIGVTRAYAVGFTIGSKGYVGTGVNPPVPLNDFYEYDPALDQWTRKADMPGVRYQGVAFVVDGKAYVGLGRADSGELGDFYKYDPSTNEWTAIATFPGGPRRSAISFSIGSKGYVGLGVKHETTVFTFYKDLWEYDPSMDEWTRVADFPATARERAIGLTVDGKGYVGLGFFYYDWWRYDPALNSWTPLAPYGQDRPVMDITGFTLKGKIYILGGYSTQCWEYDPLLDQWQRQTSIPESFGANISFSIDDAAYVSTGVFIPHNKLWKFVGN